MKRKKEIFDLSTVSFNNLIEAGDEDKNSGEERKNRRNNDM